MVEAELELRAKHRDFYKTGANFLDQNKIRKLASEGYNAEDIAQRLCIKVRVVAGFMPKEEPAPEPEPATTGPNSDPLPTQPDADIGDLIGEEPDVQPASKPRKKAAKKKTTKKAN